MLTNSKNIPFAGKLLKQELIFYLTSPLQAFYNEILNNDPLQPQIVKNSQG
jgi:hypothetical protein